jgi:superfamily II DNA or RNA helicase
MALKRFSSRLERLSRGFLDSRLNSAIAYDRIAGYFRSSVFEIAGEAFDKIDGPIRIVCNSGLDVRDVDVARALFNDWCESAPERMTERQRPRYERLATLLRAQRVEIRVLPDASFGLIHGKAGVIRYRDGSSTCFLGSINETGEAWTLHYELLWEDENAVSVAWVQAEFDALWNHRDARPLAAVVVEDVERILKRRVVQVAEWDSTTETQAPFIEAPASRQGVGLAPHQRAFVARVVHEIDTFGQARLILADDVGLGKTVQLGMAAELIALTSESAVLVLAPKNLLLQWQEELDRMLAIPSARWVDGCWLTEDGAVWPSPPDGCPRRISLFPTGLVTAGSETAQALLNRRYSCVVLDEAHRARRQRARGREGAPTKLLEFMLDLAARADTVLMATATPVQMDRMELYDLMRVLHRGCERVLGGIGSNWVHNPAAAMDLVGGQAEPHSSIASLWAWLRDPLIPAGESSLATQLRAQLGVPDSQTSASVDELDRLGQPLRRRLEALGSELVRYHNPFVRHVIKRRRRDLRAADGTPVFREVPINLHGEGDDDALVMSEMMSSAYEDARAYCQRIAEVRPGAGILRTLLLRRIGSSLRAGLLTARKLRDGVEQTLLAEEEEGAAEERGSDVDREALEKLKSAIEKMEAAGDADPKLEIALRYLRREGWVERGCILFSQYLDTVQWLAERLAQAFPSRSVGIYGGQGNSFLIDGERRRGAAREEIQKRVRDRSLSLLVATDAASEGLNLQRLETLINVDLPWNPARLEQRKGRIDRIGQLAASIDILNLRYRGSVEDQVHQVLSARLEQIREIFGTIPDTLEDVWVGVAIGEVEEAGRRIEEVPSRHPFDIRYASHMPETAWERCAQVLDRYDVQRVLKRGWS